MQFTPATDAHAALAAFCSAQRAIQEAKAARQDDKRRLRAQLREHRQRLITALEGVGDGTCIEITGVDGVTLFARLASRKGAVRQLSSKNVADAIGRLTETDVARGDGGPSVLVEAIVGALTGPSKKALSVVQRRPADVRLVHVPHLGDAGRQIAAHTDELKSIRGREKELCEPHQARCQQTEQDVVAHLRRHDPVRMTQQIRLGHRGGQQAYTLRAKTSTPKPARQDVLSELHRAIVDIVGTLRGEEALRVLRDAASIARLAERVDAVPVAKPPTTKVVLAAARE